MSDPVPNVDADTSHVNNPSSGVTLKRKPSRPPSAVWDFFLKDKATGKATCKHCNCTYASNTSTSTLKCHTQVCKKRPTEIDKSQKKLGAIYQKYEEGNNLKNRGKAELAILDFNQGGCRTALAKMIIKDELSFRFVEGEGFKEFMLVARPQFCIPSRFTVTRDCMALYLNEKSRLKCVFSDKSIRFSLTTDTWNSVQNLNYMVITCHYIDANWNYEKKILSFCLVPNHKGDTIGYFLKKCLLEWDIEKVTTVTLDNASCNNLAISHLSKKVRNWKGDLLEGRFMLMRCCAHILNLVVTEGLKEQDPSIYRIRAAIKHIKSSPARETRFDLCIEKEKITSKCSICLDVPTRWNSTYLMLETAEKFETTFYCLGEEDEHYKHMLKLDRGKPTSDDWNNARHLSKFLKIFYHATLNFSGSTFVTSNAFFHQFCIILESLKDWSKSTDPVLKVMALNMQKKFDKYWDNEENLNYFIFVAVVLDPRYKFGCVEWCFDRLYAVEKSKGRKDKVKVTLDDLYKEYCVLYPNSTEQAVSDSQYVPEFTMSDHDISSSLTSQYKEKIKENDTVQKKSELERYLAEDIVADYKGFNILSWWRGKISEYPILSCMAKGILAIPVSSVASESAFSTGGHILDPFRSSLNPRTVEELICAQNCFRSVKIDFRKQLDEIKSIEEEILKDTQPMDVE